LHLTSRFHSGAMMPHHQRRTDCGDGPVLTFCQINRLEKITGLPWPQKHDKISLAF
jgi:hypothetical protein